MHNFLAQRQKEIRCRKRDQDELICDDSLAKTKEKKGRKEIFLKQSQKRDAWIVLWNEMMETACRISATRSAFLPSFLLDLLRYFSSNELKNFKIALLFWLTHTQKCSGLWKATSFLYSCPLQSMQFSWETWTCQKLKMSETSLQIWTIFSPAFDWQILSFSCYADFWGVFFKHSGHELGTSWALAKHELYFIRSCLACAQDV